MLYAVLLGILALLGVLTWLLTMRKSNAFHLAQKLMSEGNYDEAITRLTEIAENPNHYARANVYLAECHEKMDARDLARRHYRKAIDAGAFESNERVVEVFLRIIELYRVDGDYEGIFETSLEILKLDPKNEQANQEVGLLALGDGQFAVAETYLAAALENSDDAQIQLAYAVASWQRGEQDNALSVMEQALESNPDNETIKLVFATMATSGSRLPQGKKASLELIQSATNLSSLSLLFDLYLWQCYQAKAWREALDFLRQRNEQNKLPEEKKMEYQYILLVLYLHEEMFLEASRLLRDLDDGEQSYRDMKHLKTCIDQIDLNPHTESIKPFKQILSDTFSGLLPNDLTYTVSGFKKNRGIAFTKYFDFVAGEPVLRIEYDAVTPEKGTNLFQQMPPDEFQRFVLYIITRLEYNEPVKENSGEKDLILYSAISSKSKSIRALFAFYRLRGDAHISDISLRNLQNKMQLLKADKTYIISGAQMTEGAQVVLAAESTMKQFAGDRLAEWLQDFYKARR
ncbi:MAG TPA: tetratricopeptide repeat protein [Turneriella sp.]|nr:tetratricopeptide repeat protein [Turneriella sp.]